MSFSTAEAELLSYLEAHVVAENVGSLVEILQEVPGCEPLHEDVEDDVVTGELVFDDEGFIEAHGSVVQKLIYRHSTSAIAVLSLPGGAWRTRHLRLRSSGLREKLRQRKVWALRHLPGGLLVADHLTKPINPKTKWSHFFKFMGMCLRGGKDEGEPIAFNDESQKLKRLLKREVTKIAPATVGVVTLEAVRPGLMSEKQKQAVDEMELELNDYILARLKVLHKNGFPRKFADGGQGDGSDSGTGENGALGASEKTRVRWALWPWKMSSIRSRFCAMMRRKLKMGRWSWRRRQQILVFRSKTFRQRRKNSWMWRATWRSRSSMSRQVSILIFLVGVFVFIQFNLNDMNDELMVQWFPTMVLGGVHGGVCFVGLYFLAELLHKVKVIEMEDSFGKWPSSSWSTRSLWW